MRFPRPAARTTFWHYILVYLVLSILLDILGIRLLSTVVDLRSGAHARDQCSAPPRRQQKRLADLVPTIPAFLTVSLFYLFWPLGVVFALATVGLLGLSHLSLRGCRARPGPNPYGPDPKGIPPPERRFVRQNMPGTPRPARLLL